MNIYKCAEDRKDYKMYLWIIEILLIRNSFVTLIKMFNRKLKLPVSTQVSNAKIFGNLEQI